MAEIHGVARVAVRACYHNAFRRDIETRTAPAVRHAVSSHESVLQIAPNEQNRSGRIHDQRATMQAQFECDDRNRIDDKGAVGRSLVPSQDLPPRQIHHSFCRICWGAAPTPKDCAMLGNAVAITVPSSVSMKKAAATISAISVGRKACAWAGATSVLIDPPYRELGPALG